MAEPHPGRQFIRVFPLPSPRAPAYTRWNAPRRLVARVRARVRGLGARHDGRPAAAGSHRTRRRPHRPGNGGRGAGGTRRGRTARHLDHRRRRAEPQGRPVWPLDDQAVRRRAAARRRNDRPDRRAPAVRGRRRDRPLPPAEQPSRLHEPRRLRAGRVPRRPSPWPPERPERRRTRPETRPRRVPRLGERSRRSPAVSRFALAGVLLVALAGVAGAEGPLLVNGAGDPLVWTTIPVPFNADRGTLGALDNATAIAHVAQNFGVWAAVPTASISAANAGALPVDVTAANYTSYLGVCNDGLSPIIFDTDGSITDDVFGAGASNSVLGFAGPECGTYVPPVITEGSAVLNGKWIDGVSGSGNPEIPVTQFDGVFVHEFGHYLDLDHSQINLTEALDGDASNNEAIATMFPFLVSGTNMSTLTLDDRVAISTLYPAPSFATGFGTITGSVRRSGGTPFQGAFVIARKVSDPRITAVGVVSGARYFPTNQGGPPDPSLEGSYELPGLPAGSYTVEVEPVFGAFTGGSSVGPLDPSALLPGPPEFWNGANEAGTNPPDDPSAAVPVAVTAGATVSGIDIVLNASNC